MLRVMDDTPAAPESPGAEITEAAPESRGGADISEPLALRALAHPLRWRLIDVLGTEGSATATRCAEVTGESVASCSYHLGILAKYGYIELVPGRAGREKPWRLTSFRQDLVAGPGIEGELAAEAAIEAFLDHELARTKAQQRHRGLEPPEWQDASCLIGSMIFVTADELKQLSRELADLATRYAGRLEDPASQAGARQVRVFASAAPTVPIAPGPPAPPRSEPDLPSLPDQEG